MHKKLIEFYKKFYVFKKLNPQSKEKEDLKGTVLDDIGDLLNELYYVYQDKYNEGKNGLTTKDKKKFDYRKLRLGDDYEHKFAEEEKNKSDKKPDKKQPPQNQQKMMQKNFMN